MSDLEITPQGVTRRAKVEHRETFVLSRYSDRKSARYSDGKGRAIPIGRALAIPGGIVSSTTAERNEVKRDAGGLDRAKHGKPEGQNVNEVHVLAKACKASVATASLLADMTEPKPRTL